MPKPVAAGIRKNIIKMMGCRRIGSNQPIRKAESKDVLKAWPLGKQDWVLIEIESQLTGKLPLNSGPGGTIKNVLLQAISTPVAIKRAAKIK